MDGDSSPQPPEEAPAAQTQRADAGTSPVPLILPDDVLCAIFQQFVSSWQPWVPWAPVGWLPPPPLTPSFLVSPGTEGSSCGNSKGSATEYEDFNALRVAICLVCKRWLRVAEGTESLWTNLFAASASSPTSPGPRRSALRNNNYTVFGCCKMTLSQRVSVPLQCRQTREEQIVPLGEQVRSAPLPGPVCDDLADHHPLSPPCRESLVSW